MILLSWWSIGYWIELVLFEFFLLEGLLFNVYERIEKMLLVKNWFIWVSSINVLYGGGIIVRLGGYGGDLFVYIK